jgi:PAS domain S-box-containing protein
MFPHLERKHPRLGRLLSKPCLYLNGGLRKDIDGALPESVVSSPRSVEPEVPKEERETLPFQAEPRCRQIIEAFLPFVWSCHPDGAMKWTSPALLAYVGASQPEMLDQGWLEYIHPEERASALSAWRGAVTASVEYHTDYRLRRHDGTYRRFEARAILLRDDAGHAAEWFGRLAEIPGDRVEADGDVYLELRDERDRLAKMARSTPVILHSFRRAPDGTLTIPFGAERLAPICEMAPETLEADAAGMMRHVHPEDLEALRQAQEESWRYTLPWHAEFRMLHSRRGVIWLEGHSVPMPEPDGGTVWHGAITDITDRKLSEQALRESQAELAAVIENLSDGLMTCSLEGTVMTANPAAMRLYGFSSVGDWQRPLADYASLFELSTLEGEPVTFEEWPFSRILRGGAISNLELRIRHFLDGWEKIFRYSGGLVRDDAGRPFLAMVHVADVTEQKRVEKEIRALNVDLERRVANRTRELEAVNKELEAFSYSVSHDLRAPLRTIDGFSQALVEDFGAELPEDARRLLGLVRKGALRMGQLIDDLLALSRLGRRALRSAPIDVRRLVEECLAELGETLGSSALQAEITLGELPPAVGDASLVRQVFLNLLSNAFKYSRHRRPPRVEISSHLDRSGKVAYFVRDNGTGFDMTYAHRLFNVFQRLHREDEFEGTGVGLAIVKRIVTRHGGEVWVEAAPDQGATFFFTLTG